MLIFIIFSALRFFAAATFAAYAAFATAIFRLMMPFITTTLQRAYITTPCLLPPLFMIRHAIIFSLRHMPPMPHFSRRCRGAWYTHFYACRCLRHFRDNSRRGVICRRHCYDVTVIDAARVKYADAFAHALRAMPHEAFDAQARIFRINTSTE